MKRKLMIVVGVILMLGIVSAIAVGTILTQNQINNVNVDEFDLNEGFIRNGNNKIVVNCVEGICKVGASMISVDREMEFINWTEEEKLENNDGSSGYWKYTGDYIVVDRIKYIRFDKKYWAGIRDETNATYARKGLSEKLIQRRDKLVIKERRYLENLQDYQDVDLSDVLADLE